MDEMHYSHNPPPLRFACHRSDHILFVPLGYLDRNNYRL